MVQNFKVDMSFNGEKKLVQDKKVIHEILVEKSSI